MSNFQFQIGRESGRGDDENRLWKRVEAVLPGRLRKRWEQWHGILPACQAGNGLSAITPRHRRDGLSRWADSGGPLGRAR